VIIIKDDDPEGGSPTGYVVRSVAEENDKSDLIITRSVETGKLPLYLVLSKEVIMEHRYSDRIVAQGIARAHH